MAAVAFDEGSAQRLAAKLLDGRSARWRHVVGVAKTAETVAGRVIPDDRSVVVAAAWLHDIGYAEAIANTGFHPLDGARYLRSEGAEQRLCRLVANHSRSSAEAEARGLADVLATEFPPEHSAAADVLTYADMTTGPTGLRVTVEERLAEISTRYPTGSIVHESIQRASLQLIETVRRVEALFQQHVHPR